MRLSVLRVVAFTSLSAIASTHASAQICIGRPSNVVAPTNVGIGASFATGGKGIGASFGFGNEKSFGDVGLAHFNYSGSDAGSTSLSGMAGLSMPIAEGSPVRICPIAQASFGYGPNQDSQFGDIRIQTLGLLGGVAIGGVVEVNPGFSVIPNANGGVLFQRASVSVDGDSESGNTTGGLISAGVSLLFGTNFTIEPAVSVPLGFESNQSVFSIGVTVGFKRRP